MGFVNSPNMGFPIPTVAGEFGPQYATDINQALYNLDSHNHSPGQGVPLGAQSIFLQSDLSFNINNAINLRTARFVSTTASSGTDVGALYVKGVDLFYNDLNANVIRLTLNGGLASTSIFTGQISTTAIVSANAGVPASTGFIRMVNNVDFVAWRNAGNSGDDKVYFDNTDTFQVIGLGGVQTDSVKLRDPVSSKIVTLKASQSTSAYNVNFPINPPIASSGLLMLDATGNLKTLDFVASKAVFPVGVYPASTTMAWINGTTHNTIDVVDATTPFSSHPVVVSANPNTAGLMMVRGTLSSSAATLSGEGFSANKDSAGIITVTMATPFVDSPAVTVTPLTGTGQPIMWVNRSSLSTSAFQTTCVAFPAGGVFEQGFSFIAIGQRL